MESENNRFEGFQDEELDPIVFTETNDSPELRESALSIPRPIRDEEYIGPKKSRAELLLETSSEEYTNGEWVPVENEKLKTLPAKSNIEALSQIFGKLVLFTLPIGIIAGFLLYAGASL